MHNSNNLFFSSNFKLIKVYKLESVLSLDKIPKIKV